MININKLRVKVRARVIDEQGKIIQPIIFNGEVTDGTECYNSGGRGLLFPYYNRSRRVKGVNPYGILTSIVGYSPQNKIGDIRKFADEMPKRINDVSGKPFAVLSKEAAEREKNSLDRINWFYWKRGLKPPYSFESMSATGIPFNGQDTYQLVFDLARVEDDIRVEEFNMLLKEKLDGLTSEEIKERERDILKLYHRIMTWHGFNTRALAEAHLLPTWQSFAPQNYVIAKVTRYGRTGYGIFRCDHTSTQVVETINVEDILDELFTRIPHGQTDGPIATFAAIPTAVSLAANHQHEIPKGNGPIFHRSYNFKGAFRVGEWYLNTLSILHQAFMVGLFATEHPALIDEEFFARVLE